MVYRLICILILITNTSFAQKLNKRLVNRLIKSKTRESILKIVPKLVKQEDGSLLYETNKYQLEAFLDKDAINEIHITPKKSFLIQNIEGVTKIVQLKGTIGHYQGQDHYFYLEQPELGLLYKVFRTGLIKYIVIKSPYKSKLEKHKLGALLKNLQIEYKIYLNSKNNEKVE